MEPLEKALTARLKSDAVKQEVDRHEDMLRACLRAVDALNRWGAAGAAAGRARRKPGGRRPGAAALHSAASSSDVEPVLLPCCPRRRAEACEPFQAMMRRTVLGNAVLKEKLAAIEKERAETEGATAAA